MAIVGAGVAGLVAAYRLRRDCELVVFEQREQAGGHANTVTIKQPDGPLSLDTGFLVYNERTYPLFTRLLRELDVETIASDMSFSVVCDRCGLAYGSTPRGLFAQRHRLLDPRHWRLLADFTRLGAWGRRVRQTCAGTELEVTLGAALSAQPLSRDVVSHYLLPMTSAIWSSSVREARAFPLSTWLTFVEQHGLLQLFGRPQWRSIAGGSRTYVDALVRRLGSVVSLATPVRAVTRRPGGVCINTDAGVIRAEGVIMATHADETLRLLTDADDEERQALGAIGYTSNEAVLHTDASQLPAPRNAWAAWNYRIRDCAQEEAQEDAAPQVTYWLNALQRLRAPTEYCVTLNPTVPIPRDRILGRFAYQHPAYTVAGNDARQRIRQLSGRRRTWFAGAYLGYGFHEDGVRAGTDAADAVRRRSVS
jgi:predicted NAD/FAD-binding protein